MRNKILSLACQSAAISMCMGTALGQSSDTGAGTAATAQLETVVVTAQRREEQAIAVPLAVSAASGDLLKATNSTDLSDLASLVSGLTIPKIGGMAMPTIRGIGTRSVSTGDEQVVPVYVDGVYQSVLLAASYDLGDVERVEVLKGPQGALYGRNATGGAINIITKKPTAGFNGNAEVEAGNLDSRAFSGFLNAGSDVLAGNLAVAYRETGDWVHNIYDNTDTGGSLSRSVRGRVAFRPNDSMDWTLSAVYSDGYDRAAIDSVPLNGNTSELVVNPNVLIASSRGQVAINQVNDNPRRFNSYDLIGTIKFSAADLVTVSSWQHTTTTSDFDGDNTPDVGSRLYIRTYGDAIYHEDYLRSTGESSFDWIVGGVFYKSTTHLDPQQVFVATPAGFIPVVAINATTGTKSYAAYFEGTYHFTPTVSAIAGARYTQETRDVSGTINGATRVPDSATFSRTTPTMTVQWMPSENLDMYVRYGKAFKAGVYNVGSPTATLVKPEDVGQTEIGVKSTFGPFRYVNFSLYHSDYNDLQVTTIDPVSHVAVLSNAASARINGAELELSLGLGDQFALHGSASYTDSEYTDFKNASVFVPDPAAAGGNISSSADVSGNPLALVPKFSGNFGLLYSSVLPIGDLSANLTAHYSGKFNSTADGRIEQPAYTVLNANIGYCPASFRAMCVALYGQNLTNKIYDVSVITAPGGDSHSYALPRTYGVKFTAHF